MLLTKSVSSTQEYVASRTMGAFTINYGQIVESVVTECIVSNVDLNELVRADEVQIDEEV